MTFREECQRVIRAFFEVAVANDNAKGLCFLLNTVCAGIGLQQIMIQLALKDNLRPQAEGLCMYMAQPMDGRLIRTRK